MVEVLDINNKDHLKDLVCYITTLPFFYTSSTDFHSKTYVLGTQFKKLKVAGPLPDEQDTSNAAAKAFFSGHTDAKGLPVVHDSQVSSAST